MNRWIRLLQHLQGNFVFHSHGLLSRLKARLSAKHKAHNLTLCFDGLIEQQRSGEPAAARLGFCLTGPGGNACGWIAVYNLCLLAGRPIPPERIIADLERCGGLILDGIFGTNPLIYPRLLQEYGFQAQRFTELDSAAETALQSSGLGILTFINPGGILHGAHNVCVQWADGRYRLHNPRIDPGHRNLQDYLEQHGMRFLSLTVVQVPK